MGIRITRGGGIIASMIVFAVVVTPLFAHAQTATNTTVPGVSVTTTASPTPTASAPAAASPTPVYRLQACQNASIINVRDGVSCAISTVIISLTAGITGIFTSLMDMSAALFNWSIKATVLDFGSIYQKVSDPATKAWTAIRDLANILIIGFFVFIAISIILGLQEYGQKKLIARVIIVATLINFSFLFTSIVINSSNYLAKSVYESGIAPRVPDVAGQSSTAGIADKFKQALGIQSVHSGDSTLWNQLAEQYDTVNGSMLWHSITIIVFSSIAAIAFFFASFLLIGRVIILLFLLVFSSAAFATYLIPSLAESGMGWGTWWQKLLKNSFFAPLLMVSLAISLSFANGLALGNAANLGSLTGTPTADVGINSILAYAMILGIFVLGVIIANSLASGVASRSAKLIPGLGLAMGAATGGMIGRNTAGYLAAKRKESIDGDIKQWRKDNLHLAPEKRDYSKLNKLIAQRGRAETLSKSSFDMRAGMLGSALKSAGVPEAMSKASTKNYDKTSHDAVKAAVDTAMKGAMSKKEAQDIAKSKYEEEVTQVTKTRDQARDEHEQAQTAANEYQRKNAGELQKLRDVARAEAEKNDLQNQHRNAPEAEKANLMTRIQAKDQEISAARQKIINPNAARDLQQLKNLARIKRTESREAEQDYKVTQGKVDRAANTILDQNRDDVKQLGDMNVGNKFTQVLRNNFGQK